MAVVGDDVAGRVGVVGEPGTTGATAGAATAATTPSSLGEFLKETQGIGNIQCRSCGREKSVVEPRRRAAG
jgi:hypothetical protein